MMVKNILQTNATGNSLICNFKILCNSVNDTEEKGTSTPESGSPSQ
jgi:hypothetical protein